MIRSRRIYLVQGWLEYRFMTQREGYGLRGGESTRARVLQAAAIVLASRGYAGTTLKEIAEIAGTKAGSLYYYFSSREDLIRELMQRGIWETVAHVEAALSALPDTATSRDRLLAAVQAYVRHVLTESAIARASIRTLGQAPPEVEGPAIEMHREFGRYLHALIEEAKADGYLAADLDVRVLRLLLAGAVNWSTAWFREDGPSTVDEIAALAGRLVLGELH
jgi:TetR/AcrR family transcriptional regulator, cholesterol catabolism regulator